MKKLLLILLCLPMIGFGQKTINAGQIVKIFSLDEITSKKANIGDVFQFAVYDDVLSTNGEVIIKKFTLVNATISEVEKAKSLGRKGNLTIMINFINAVDGTPIKVDSYVGDEGNSRTAVTIIGAVGAFFTFGAPLLIKGSQAKIKSGTISLLEVKEKVTITRKIKVQDHNILIDKLIANMNFKSKAQDYIKSLIDKKIITHIEVSNLFFEAVNNKIKAKEQIDWIKSELEL